MKHKTEDYKISVVKYYLKNDVSMDDVCETCSALWNRDENSARNIYKIAYNAINGKGRPSYLSRSTVSSSTTSVDKLQCQSTSVDATQS